MSHIAVGILLAAGKSQRFNSNKLLHPIVNNTPMLLVAAQKLANVLPDSIVVISPRLQPFTEQLEQLGLRVVVNQQAEQGMGSSIACGVKASQYASGWLIALADMPYIKSETHTLLAGKLAEGAKMVAPQFNQQRGHPVGFSNVYLDELLLLNKDIGARNIIKSHQEQLELILTDDEGVIRDIDYPDDV